MPIIRIPESDAEKVWRALVDSGPISRISRELIYAISKEQLRLLKRKKLPYEIISPTDVPDSESNSHG